MDGLDHDLEAAETAASKELSRRDTYDSSTSSEVDSAIISRHATQLESIRSANLQHVATVGSTRPSRPETEPLPAFGANKPYPPDIPAEREAYVVDFDGPADPLHPMNWHWRTKFGIAAIGALACLCSTFASAVLSAATRRIAVYYDLSLEVASLSSVLYLVGYGVGPAIWAPLSEIRGRKLPLLLGNFGFSVFGAAVATSKDVQTLMICRFFMGVFGSSPLVIVAAMYSDMYRAEQRGIALVVFAVSVFMGPMIAPFIGAFTVESYLGWRWDGYCECWRPPAVPSR
jgi:MFS transporter, DHA1 family, multidrug resistance protein